MSQVIQEDGGLEGGSTTLCRKGNWWDKVVFWSTPLNQSSAGGGDQPDAWRGGVWLALKNAATEKQCCPLGNVLMLLLPLPPCLAGEKGINHVAIICTGLNKGCESFELPNSNPEFPTWEGNGWVVVAQAHILWGPTSPWQILHLSWPTLLVFCMVRHYMSCGNCMCSNDPLLGVFFLSILWNSKARLQWGLSNYVAALNAY